MAKNYRQFPRRRVPPAPRVSAPPYMSYWVKPVNQPLKNRIGKRQQPASVNHEQPPYPAGKSAAPYVSYWIHPVNQPQLRRKAREITIPGGGVSSVNQAPYLSYWVKPVNQPIRRSRRTQPIYNTTEPYYGISVAPPAAPSVSSWIHPVNQPGRSRRRLQPPIRVQARQPLGVNTWLPEQAQPLRRTQKRQLPRFSKPFLPPGSVATPQVSAWIRPKSQPTKTLKRQQPAPRRNNPFYSITTAATILVSQWIHPVNQPMKRWIRRLQPIFRAIPPLRQSATVSSAVPLQITLVARPLSLTITARPFSVELSGQAEALHVILTASSLSATITGRTSRVTLSGSNMDVTLKES